MFSLNKNNTPILLMAMVALAAVAIFYVYNPAEEHFFWTCQFKQITGYQCPGCGGQRAIHALLHGRFAEAYRFNALFVSGLPFMLWYIWKKTILSRWVWWAIIVVVMGFGVLRNVLI